MNFLEIQPLSSSQQLPSRYQFQQWLDAVLKKRVQNSEIVIRIVDKNEMIEFNSRYRDKKYPTNILSFPFDGPAEVASNLLGDLLVCAPVVEQESLLQNKPLEHHWAHMIIHGVLHLLGYNHINDIEAEAMEAIEIKILKKMQIANPYIERKITNDPR